MPLAKIAWSGQKQGLRGPGRGVENQLPHQSMIPKSGSRFSERSRSNATVQQDSPS
jgi:hypothetical protein